MKKLVIVVVVMALTSVSYGQWGMMQPQMNLQQMNLQLDSWLASLSPEQRQEAVSGYWQYAVISAKSGNVIQQQIVASVAQVILKYDPQFQEHLQAAMQVASFMPNIQPNLAMPMPCPMPIPSPMPALGGGGGGSGTCPICYGSGNCKLCHGTGTYRNYGQSVQCDRKCSACGGTGRR